MGGQLFGDARNAENSAYPINVLNVDSKGLEVEMVAKVLVGLKILPEDVEVDLKRLVNEVSKKLPEGYNLHHYQEEPIAFGLKALKLYISMPEETEGGTERLEEIVKNVEGVSQVEVDMVTRIS